MNKFKIVVYDFKFLIERRDNWVGLAIGLVLITLLVVGLNYGVQDQSLGTQGWEKYPVGLYFLINLVGIAVNKKNWNTNFFFLVLLSMIVSIFRILILLVFTLAISTIFKILGVFILNTSPYEIDRVFQIFSNLVFFYPLVQAPLFFWQFKNRNNQYRVS